MKSSSILNLMGQKGLAPILIILLIAAATFGYLIYSGKINLKQTTTQVAEPSPTPDASPAPNGAGETADWKTYTNVNLGYSIEYPPSWNLYELKNYPYSGYPGIIDKDRVIITTFPKFPRFSTGDGSGDVYTGIDIYLGNDLYADISDVLKRADNPDVAGNTTGFKELTINGITAYQEIRATDKSTLKRILIPYQNKSGIIIVVGESPSPESDKQVMNQILSTFKLD